KDNHVVWSRPRFEAANKAPLLLRDYLQYRWDYEIDFRAVYANTAKYLAAAAAAAHDRTRTAADLAKEHGLDAAWLQRWIDVLDIDTRPGEPKEPGKRVP